MSDTCDRCHKGGRPLSTLCEYCVELPPIRVKAEYRLPRRVLEALEAAAQALEDLGACDDSNCRAYNCNHALTKVRTVLAEQ